MQEPVREPFAAPVPVDTQRSIDEARAVLAESLRSHRRI